MSRRKAQKKAQKQAQQLSRFGWRSGALKAGFALVALGLVGGSFYRQIIQHERMATKAQSRHVVTVEVPAHRGTIFDRNGEPLAMSTPVDSIGAKPRELLQHVDALPKLARVLGLDPDQLLKKLNRNLDKEFVFLRRRVKPQTVAAVNALELHGISAKREYRRFYPATEVTSHLIGLTNVNDIGHVGFEKAWNPMLAGKPGANRVLKDRHGRMFEHVDSVRPPRHGESIRTSIDLRLQYFAYLALKSAMEQFKAQNGSVVILDVHTGEVLAMVNQPSYNPHSFAEYSGERSRNRAVSDIVEPGSSIKPLIVAAALELGVIDPQTIIDTSPGRIQVDAKLIEDHHDLGEIDLTTLVARSSNVGIVKIAQQIDREDLWQSLVAYGFGELTGARLPGESAGLLNHFIDWQRVTHATVAYGYGLAVTPLQLARAYAAIGNGGELKPVSLLALDETVPGVPILSTETTEVVRGLMEHVVLPGGTGTKAAVAGYRVAGKTGTAWKASNGAYSTDNYFSLFAGLIPASDPRLAAVVVIDDPQGGDYYGGDVAAPVFATVMSEAMRLMAIRPDDVPALNAGLVESLASNVVVAQ
ncbi:MAG: penicillin-binding transpeptidase domain-containing protein [Pseudomonadota bacterium]